MPDDEISEELDEAIERDDFKKIEELLTDSNLDAVMNMAVCSLNIERIEFCLAKGAKVNDDHIHNIISSESAGDNYEGAMLAFVNTFKLLIENGADVNRSLGAKQRPPLQKALERGLYTLAEALLWVGANPNSEFVAFKDPETPEDGVLEALKVKRRKPPKKSNPLKLLLDKEDDPKKEGAPDSIYRALLERGADPTARIMSGGPTMLELAKKTKRKAVVALMEEAIRKQQQGHGGEGRG